MHKISKLENGLSFITIPLKGTKATTVLVMLPIGSRFEDRKISGISHFVEHMMFKGTPKRPTAMDISRTLDAAGADFNAFTAKEYTGYYVKIDSSRQELAYELIADMVFNSKMEEAEFEREKGVIVEELRMYEDNPTMHISLLFDSLLFGDCPLGWDEGGSKDSVQALTRDELYQFYKDAYTPGNMVLVVAGNINHTKMKKTVKENYAGQWVAKEKMDKKSFVKFEWPKHKLPLAKRVEVREKKVDQAHIILGFPGIDNNHPMRHAAAIMLFILGGGMSSRLFVEVREKRGLAYMIQSAASCFRDAGMTYVRAGLDPARLKGALQVIKEEIQKISEHGVTDRELKDAKNNISGRMALSMEESNAQAEWFAKQFWFMNKIESPDQMLNKIKKVTAKQVQAVAKQLFDFDQMRVAAIGPLKKENILKML
ncbi:insulinase family protein [Patescibacteria group bacterium]|nr:insulinase family protein [Patescibacteria group bacterium]